MHRDFMPRNLMPVADGPAVLDFQDAVRGPIAYDPVSLFKDAFVSWPLERVDAWLERYHQRAQWQPACRCRRCAQFRRDADWLGVQRHLKILGIFARLHHRDGKTAIPATMRRASSPISTTCCRAIRNSRRSRDHRSTCDRR